MIALDPSQPLHNLEEPPGLEDLEPFHAYYKNYKQAVINNINQDPRKFDTSKPCLVCNMTGHTFAHCPILNNVSNLKKHCIIWKIFLARATWQQEEILHEITVDRLKSEYLSTQEEQDYGMDEEINFLHKDELEDEDQSDQVHEDFL